MDRYVTRKLTLKDVLEIGPEDGDKRMLEDVPWYFLRKLMGLNVMARNTSLKPNPHEEPIDGEDNEELDNDTFQEVNVTQPSINPLDVLCVLMHCSDSFLQQEILLKMSMCQFALPMLLPPCDGTKCTFMLWAMRDIVKKWRPHSLRDSKGFREESLVLTPMPTISFVRLGSCSLSKSKILNEVLSPPQQHHDFFIHRDMESGNAPRRISDGLVEISWYLPGGKENSDIFPEPVAFTNLHGDIDSHWKQFIFLTEISSAVFIYIEHISEQKYELLSAQKSETKYYFILNSQTQKSSVTMDIINRLARDLKMTRSQILMKDRTINDASFAKKLQSTLLNLIKRSPKSVTVEGMAVTARELGIKVDEDCKECQTAKECAKQITEEIRDVAEYKKEMMKLQGEPWRKLAKIEKEFCRLKRQGKAHTEVYKSQLKNELLKLRSEQNKCDFTDGMVKFISGLGHLSNVEKRFFLKWMKFGLDSIARRSLSNLRDEYKEKSKDSTCDPKELAELDKRISESSLGVEHFMREMGQFYEAECFMVKEGKVTEDRRQCIKLPSIAADLLLEGFPLELIDGDASNIPLQWVTDVLTELNTKLGGQCRMIVITVLGVQSTGKSTLLNTMFGLQFSVSSGRCTRGAFMLLMKVKETLRQEFGCDFILVIDTEGLKAPELATLVDSYEHDNELATLVVGLSDITIVNMAMENATEMKDILQIVVHAFLRMEQIGKKPNCQFVHQNVSDISAHDQNMRDRKHLLEQLNKMTRAAARMEKRSEEMTFSDIMEYDADQHNWYIPGLWHGVPPMAPVNLGYSEHVHEFKRYLFEFTRARLQKTGVMNIPKFKEWVKSLWNSVKHENFIFSFRNSLVAEAYNQLSMKYSEREWDFRKEMQLWVTSKETVIQNKSLNELNTSLLHNLKEEAFQKLISGEQKIVESLKQYFESGVENLNLIEKYREDFIRSAKSLRSELESYSMRRWEEVIRIQKGKHKLKDLQNEYIKTIEAKVEKLLKDCRQRQAQLADEELEREFENMWIETLSELQLSQLEKREVHKEMYTELSKDLNTRGAAVNQMLQTAHSLHCREVFTIGKEHFDLPFYKFKGFKEIFTHECWHKTEDLVKSLLDECSRYVSDKVQSKADYDENYCRELLNVINERLQDKSIVNLHTTPHFEAELKLHILGSVVPDFQAMHERYIQENDPQLCLDKVKHQYFSTFKDLYLKKDQCQKRARDFCYQCLKPALIQYINDRLGIEVVDDILSSTESKKKYTSRMFFQFTVLEKLLQERCFENIVKYTSSYKDFVKSWISDHILDCYKEKQRLGALEENVLSRITKKIIEILKNANRNSFKTVSDVLENFCKLLQEDLIISKERLQVILFQNTANVDQFCSDVLFFVLEVEQNILAEFKDCDIQKILSKLTFKPQDEFFKKVFGCGKQCPFCKVPCEAGGGDHKEHFATIHRPQGLGSYRYACSKKLVYSICSSDVASSTMSFSNADTGEVFHPYKDYRSFYPDWNIQPDPSISASDYWKFFFKEFNDSFADRYNAKPADLPEDWKRLTKEQALKSLQEIFNIK